MTTDYKFCPRCKKLHNGKSNTCINCLGVVKESKQIAKHDLLNKCKGDGKNKCNKYVLENELFCETHIYLKNYTDEMMNNLIFCFKCKKFFYSEDGYKQCNDCRTKYEKIDTDENNYDKQIEKYEILIKEIKEKKELKEIKKQKEKPYRLCKYDDCLNYIYKEDEKYCGVHCKQNEFDDIYEKGNKMCNKMYSGCFKEISLSSESDTCSNCIEKTDLYDKKNNNKFNKMNKINLLTGNKLCSYPECNYKVDDDNLLCDKHKTKSKLCSYPKCNNEFYKNGLCIEHNEKHKITNKYCKFPECKNDIIINGLCEIHKNIDLLKCLVAKCKNKIPTSNDYCGKHQNQIYLNEIKQRGSKVCKGHYSDCEKELPYNYKFSKCQTCLTHDRVKDKKRHQKKIQKAKEIQTEYTVETIVADNDNCDSKLLCVSCPNSSNMHNGSEFVIRDMYNNFVKVSNRCNKCREHDRQIDKRDRKDRIYTYTEEQKEKKKEWKRSHKDKVKEYYTNARLKNRMKLGEKEYLRIMAEKARKYRLNNPEFAKRMNENDKKNIDKRFYIYKYSAKKRHINFEIDFNFFKQMVTDKCHYCSHTYEKDGYLLGIDRFNNCVGYLEDNCVSCCKMCNMIKCSYDVNIFKNKIKHILSYSKLLGKIYINDEIFTDNNGTSYDGIIRRVQNKKLELNFDKIYHTKLKYYDCYICGKKSDSDNINGIDRLNNKYGYIKINSLSCCADCNYMKKNYNYIEFMKKLYLINKTLRYNNSVFLAICYGNIKFYFKKLYDDNLITEQEYNQSYTTFLKDNNLL